MGTISEIQPQTCLSAVYNHHSHHNNAELTTALEPVSDTLCPGPLQKGAIRQTPTAQEQCCGFVPLKRFRRSWGLGAGAITLPI